MAPASAGNQRNVYHSGHAPYGCHSHSPATAASTAHPADAMLIHDGRWGSFGPRTSAAAASTMAMPAAASASSHDNHSATLTPAAGGAMPRPR